MTRVDWICFGLCCVWLASLGFFTATTSAPVLQAIAKAGTADWLSAIGTLAAVIVALVLAILELSRTERARRETRKSSQRDAVFNAIVLVTALLGRAANCCLGARADVLKGGAARTMSAQVRGLTDRLRQTNFADLPSEGFIHPIVTSTGQGDVASGLLDLFVDYKIGIPPDAFDDIYKRLASDHAVLVAQAKSFGLYWKGTVFSGSIAEEAKLWMPDFPAR